MERLPLLPTTDIVPASMDVAPLLREVFQNEMNMDVSLYKTTRNAEYFDAYEKTCSEIDEAEREIMKVEAKYLIEKEDKNRFPHLDEKSLRRAQLYDKINKDILDKYCLIDTNKFLKSYEEMLHFPNNEPILRLPKLPSSCSVAKFKYKSVRKGGRPSVEAIQNIRNIQSVNLMKELKAEKTYGNVLKRSRKDLVKLSVFQVVPNEIIFKDCVVGQSYTEYFIVQNTGTISKHFVVSTLSNRSAFRVDYFSKKDRVKMLAPGICSKFVVKHTCCMPKNFYDTIYINVENSPSIAVYLKAIRTAPTLAVLPQLRANISYNRFSILTQTIECGYALPGEVNIITLELNNQGSTGRFFILAEDDWASEDVLSITKSNKVVLPTFTISPAYFTVERKNKIVLTVAFQPSEFGFYTERLYVLCDNSTMTTVDLLGEGIVFEQHFLQFISLDKIYPISIDDDPSCNMIIVLNPMTGSDSQIHHIAIYNRCFLPLDYHWVLSDCNTSDRNTKQCDKDYIHISIEPKSGFLEKLFESTFVVRVQTDRAPPGSYRAVLSLFIENLDEDKVVYILKDKLIPDDDLRKRMTLEVGRIEIWLECVKPEVEIEPYVVDFCGEPFLCSCPEIPSSIISVKNLSVAQIHCFWDVPLHIVNKVKIHPIKFTMMVDETITCKIDVISWVPDSIEESITCIINNGESSSHIIVKAKFIQGYVSATTNFYDFNVMQRGSTAIARVSFMNISFNQPFWKCHEYKFSEILNTTAEIASKTGKKSLEENEPHRKRVFSVETHGNKCYRLSSSDLPLFVLRRSSKEMFTREGFGRDVSKTSFNYKLKSWIERIWCSVLLVDNGDSREYIGIIGDIQEPLITLSSSWIPIVDDMILRESTTVSIILRNHTALHIPFAWSHPTGHQQHDFLIRIKPLESVLYPRKTCEVLFRLLPLKAGVKTSLVFPCFFHKIKDPILFLLTALVKPISISVEWTSRNKFYTATWPKFLFNDQLVDWEMFKRANNLERVDSLNPFRYTAGKDHPRSSQGSERRQSVTIKTESEEDQSSQLQEKGSEIKTAENEDKNEEEEEGEEETIKSSLSSLYDIYQNYPIISGKYVINKPEEDFESLSLLDTDNDTVKSLKSENISVSTGKKESGSTIDHVSFGTNELKETASHLGSEGGEEHVKDDDAISKKSENIISSNFNEYEFKMFKAENETETQQFDYTVGTVIFDDVNCWEPTKIDITIKSYVPERMTFNLYVSNFKEYKLKKKFCIQRYKRGFCTSDGYANWNQMIQEGKGLVIVPFPKTFELTGRDMLVTGIWVYATTWGRYRDLLTIKAGYLPPLHLNIIVNVINNPLMFPALMEPVIRMGVLAYKGKSKKCFLRVTNHCSIDVIVKWSIYLTDFPAKRNKLDEQPFGLILADNDVDLLTKFIKPYRINSDTEDDSDENTNTHINDADDCTDDESEERCNVSVDKSVSYPFRLQLTPYYGTRDFDIYQLNKTRFIIKAWEEENLEITIDPQYVNVPFATLRALLIGTVYQASPEDVSSELMTSSKPEVAHYSSMIDPVILSIDATLELAKLELLNVTKADLIFKVSAIDVMKCSAFDYSISHTIKFINVGKTQIKFVVTVDKPFSIKLIKQMKSKRILPTLSETLLLPKEVCEYVIELSVSKAFIQEIISATPIPIPKTREEAKIPPKLDRDFKGIKSMVVNQHGMREKVRELSIRITFPSLYLSVGKLMFGPVYIDSTMCKSFYMNTNDSGPVYYKIVYHPENPLAKQTVFKFEPSSGHIQPKIPLEVSLYFTPNKPKDYKEKFVIQTAVPNHEVSFYAIGIGTLNCKDIHND